MSAPFKHKTHGKEKKGYKTWLEAIGPAFRHSKDQKAIVGIYKCPTCGFYHIGKQRSV